MKKLMLFGLACVAMCLAQPVVAEVITVGKIGVHRLLVDVPEGWVASSPPAAVPDAANLRLSRGDPVQAIVVLTVMSAPQGSPLHRAESSTVEGFVAESAQRASAQSVEGRLVVEPFQRAQLVGAYFSATDKAPPPGEFKYLSQGLASVGEFAVTFTALSHAEPEPTRDLMLALVASLTFETVGADSGH